MCICTYLGKYDYIKPTSDKEINDLLKEIRQRSKDDWRVRENIFTIRRWFRSPIVYKNYEIYHHIGGPEFQIINFYRPDSDGSINIRNTAGYVCAYFYGLLAGLPHESSRD